MSLDSENLLLIYKTPFGLTWSLDAVVESMMTKLSYAAFSRHQPPVVRADRDASPSHVRMSALSDLAPINVTIALLTRATV